MSTLVFNFVLVNLFRIIVWNQGLRPWVHKRTHVRSAGSLFQSQSHVLECLNHVSLFCHFLFTQVSQSPWQLNSVLEKCTKDAERKIKKRARTYTNNTCRQTWTEHAHDYTHNISLITLKCTSRNTFIIKMQCDLFSIYLMLIFTNALLCQIINFVSALAIKRNSVRSSVIGFHVILNNFYSPHLWKPVAFITDTALPSTDWVASIKYIFHFPAAPSGAAKTLTILQKPVLVVTFHHYQ